MIFSGHFAMRSCAECDLRWGRVTPTSIMFYLGLLVFGIALSTQPMLAVVGPSSVAIAVALAANVVLLLGLLAGIDILKTMLVQLPEHCPKCGRELTKGGGFYDFRSIPTLHELVAMVGYFGAILAFRSVAL
ncbi:MAG: hypothetical protein GTO22_27655 [Gemmatimonadales bacterium]|nr:hypothetical protein [Gemmatimonadales bacterium]